MLVTHAARSLGEGGEPRCRSVSRGKVGGKRDAIPLMARSPLSILGDSAYVMRSAYPFIGAWGDPPALPAGLPESVARSSPPLAVYPFTSSIPYVIVNLHQLTSILPYVITHYVITRPTWTSSCRCCWKR